jgi:hypothetical protein
MEYERMRRLKECDLAEHLLRVHSSYSSLYLKHHSTYVTMSPNQLPRASVRPRLALTSSPAERSSSAEFRFDRAVRRRGPQRKSK